MTAPRERAVSCQVCRADTWATSAVCDDCIRASYATATTRQMRAVEIRNAGVREALAVLRWHGVPAVARVEMATRILLDSCQVQGRVLP